MPRWIQSVLRVAECASQAVKRLVLRRVLGWRQRPAARRHYPVMSLPRYIGEGKPPRLEWKASHPKTIKRFKAEVTCSRGHGIVLRNHTVEADGRVVPSIVCKEPGCNFHEIVLLEGWTAGRVPARSLEQQANAA